MWKKWPYWLRGGLVLMIVTLILNVYSLTIYEDAIRAGNEGRQNFNTVIYEVTFFPLLVSGVFLCGINIMGSGNGGILGNCLKEYNPYYEAIITLFGTAILYFFVGALIGHIYGKLKNHNNDDTSPPSTL